MKKIYFVIIGILIISLGLNFYFFVKDWGIHTGIGNNVVGIIESNENVSDSGLLIENDKSISNSGGLTKDEINIECKKIINGEKSEYLENNKGELLSKYENGLEVLQKNEYEMFLDLRNGNCDNFKDDNKVFCEAYKSKDLSLTGDVIKKGTYGYVLLSSLIENQDNCNLLKLDYEKTDCEEKYKGFMQLDVAPNSDNLLNNDSIENGKNYVKLGKDGYLKLLNSQFIYYCNIK